MATMFFLKEMFSRIRVWLNKYGRFVIPILLFVVFTFSWDVARRAYYRNGYDDGYLAAENKAKAEAEKQKKANDEQARNSSIEHEDIKEEIQKQERIQYVEIEKIVEKPVYRNICIDDDGLHIINKSSEDYKPTTR